MTDERIKSIVEAAKLNLRIDWNDDDPLIQFKVKRSFKYFEGITGADLTFADDSAETELLLERVRYDWNNALDDFENNYKSEILALIMSKALEAEPDGTD